MLIPSCYNQFLTEHPLKSDDITFTLKPFQWVFFTLCSYSLQLLCHPQLPFFSSKKKPSVCLSQGRQPTNLTLQHIKFQHGCFILFLQIFSLSHLLTKSFLSFLPRVPPSSILLSVPQVSAFFTTSLSHCTYLFIFQCVHYLMLLTLHHTQLECKLLRVGILSAIFYWCTSRAQHDIWSTVIVYKYFFNELMLRQLFSVPCRTTLLCSIVMTKFRRCMCTCAQA